MTEQTITVTGMTCDACVRHVRSALAQLPGVHNVTVDLASGHATLAVDEPIDAASLRTTLEADEYGLL